MRISVNCIAVLAVAGLWATASQGQSEANRKLDPVPAAVQLELTAEVATTTEEGYPAAVRITIQNVGIVPADMPMPQSPCVPGGGGISIQHRWEPADSKDHTFVAGGNAGCSQDHFAPLLARIRHEWIRLRPGDFITVSENVREDFRVLETGSIEYWAEYHPPSLTTEEKEQLKNAGYNFPSAKLETEHVTFRIH
jgi:hypothetical protein